VFLDATKLEIIMPLVDSVTMASTSPTKATLPAKPSIPVELLPTDLARIVSQAHPVLLLSAYYLRFPALVADPVSSLLNSLLPLAVIQIAYAVICLPAVGTASKPLKKPKLGEKKKTPEASSAKVLVYLTLYHLLQINAD
jgi:GPI ethanolamine phosphate transferase 2/3 subunit F